jgi:di/tricarboxylate transporter
MEIDREGQILAAVGPQTRLAAGDRLVFVGIVDSVVDLQKFHGLTPATNQVFKLDAPRTERCLIEAVVSNTCPIAGMSIRDGQFRTTYNAVVIAVGRNGERIQKKIGDIVLRSGDTLLLEAHPSFVEQQRDSRDFYLVSRIKDSTPPRHDRVWIALGVLLTMVVTAGAGWLSMLNAAMLAAGLMIITGCIAAAVARKSVDWQVLIVIAAAFGIGEAMEKTGAAGTIAGAMIHLAGSSPHASLAVVYGVTMLFTELLSNNAAAVLVFPIGIATAGALGVNHLPFAIAIMFAASFGFATPIGYQTNLMVYGPGGYRFFDYLRIGVPLNLILWVIATLLIPHFWPFCPA